MDVRVLIQIYKAITTYNNNLITTYGILKKVEVYECFIEVLKME